MGQLFLHKSLAGVVLVESRRVFFVLPPGVLGVGPAVHELVLQDSEHGLLSAHFSKKRISYLCLYIQQMSNMFMSNEEGR